MTMEFWFLLALSFAAFLSFAWGVQGHFRVAGRMPPVMLALSIASFVFYCLFLQGLWSIKHIVWPIEIIASVLLIVALVLYWWTIATTRAHPPRVAHSDADADSLYRHGPYRMVRHPFYLSYMMFWVATGVSVGGLQIIASIIMLVWYRGLASAEERRFAGSALARPYAEYQRESAMFLPIMLWRRNGGKP